MDFQFRTIQDREDLVRLIGFIREQSQGYSNYQDWVSRTEAEIDMGYKTGIIALNCNHVVGDIIWQPHKELPRIREIKNMRVHPSVRGRYFARFFMKQAEAENPGDYDELMLDLREDHPDKIPLMRMLTSMGYEKIFAASLYDSNVKDIVMVKKVA